MSTNESTVNKSIGKTVGIIAEYNPFHNGHLYQINKIREKFDEPYIVAIMSGNFTQRGEAAILDKWQRARLAVENGVNLVIELPFMCAVMSAEFFARNGVMIFNRLYSIDTLAFSCETPDIDTLREIATLSLSDEFQEHLREGMMKGNSYAKAVENALCAEMGPSVSDIIREPNNILAVEYLKALIRTKSSIRPFVIKRYAAGHKDEKIHGTIASGTAIRNAVAKNNVDEIASAVPQNTFEALKLIKDVPSVSKLYRSLQTIVIRGFAGDVHKMHGMNEGLANRIINAAKTSGTYEDFCANVRSKRYPLTRIMRACLNLLLNIDIDLYLSAVGYDGLYARILAFDNKGREIIKRMNEHAKMPIINKTSKFISSNVKRSYIAPLPAMLSVDIKATYLYSLCRSQAIPFLDDFTTSPIFVE